jgi:hypothetical protein
MMGLFKYLDLIGPKPYIYVNKKDRFKTVLGGLLTIFLCILSILACFAFGYDIFYKKKPEVLISKRYDPYPIQNNNGTMFLLAPMYRGGSAISDIDKKLKMYITYVARDETKVANFTSYDLVPCNTTKRFQENLYNVNTSLLGYPYQYYCLPEGFNYTLENKYGAAIFKNYQIFVAMCDNSTMNNSCYSKQAIESDLNLLFVHFVFLDYYIDSSDYNNPIKPIFSADLLQGSATSTRVDYYFLRKLSIETDSGVILSDLDKRESFQLESRTNFVSTSNNIYMYQINVSVMNIWDIYERKYIKVQTIMANVGGFITLTFEILAILNAYFANIYFYESVLLNNYKKLSEYRTTPTVSNPVNLKLFRMNITTHKSSLPLQTGLNNLTLMDGTTSKITNILSTINKLSEYPFEKLNLVKIVGQVCRKSPRAKMLDKIMDYLRVNLDVENLLRLNNKVETTDKLIFDGKVGLKNMLMYREFVKKLTEDKQGSNMDILKDLNKLYEGDGEDIKVGQIIKKYLEVI